MQCSLKEHSWQPVRLIVYQISERDHSSVHRAAFRGVYLGTPRAVTYGEFGLYYSSLYFASSISITAAAYAGDPGTVAHHEGTSLVDPWEPSLQRGPPDQSAKGSGPLPRRHIGPRDIAGANGTNTGISSCANFDLSNSATAP